MHFHPNVVAVTSQVNRHTPSVDKNHTTNSRVLYSRYTTGQIKVQF